MLIQAVFTGVIFDTRVYGPWTRVVCTELYLRRTLLRLYQTLLMMIAQQCNDWYTMAVDRWTVNIWYSVKGYHDQSPHRCT